jgi:hypothetical protein
MDEVVAPRRKKARAFEQERGRAHRKAELSETCKKAKPRDPTHAAKLCFSLDAAPGFAGCGRCGQLISHPTRIIMVGAKRRPDPRRFMPGAGFEPARPTLGTADFKSAAYRQFRHPGGHER